MLFHNLNSTAEKSDFFIKSFISQFECGTIKIKFLVFCLRAIKTCFFNLFFALFIFPYQYPVKKTISGINRPSLTFSTPKCYKIHQGVMLQLQYEYYAIFWKIFPMHLMYMHRGYWNIITCFFNLFFALFIFPYQYPVKKTISGIWQSNILKN
jgi:hypothetical protein